MATPDLGDLAAFVAVAQQRSFRGAAALRNVSASSLSETIRRLEERLGVRLLNRTTRSVTPTEAGARLLERLQPVLGEVAAALDTINDFRDTPTGTLRLNVPTVVAKHVLPGMIDRFLLAFPGITLEVIANDTFIDILAAGFDAGIRYDESLERDMVRIPIGPRRQRFCTAASPAYLAKRGRPEHPNDLLRHDCIRHRFASGVSPAWEFEQGQDVIRIVPQGPLISNEMRLEVHAARQGLGLIHTFAESLAPALAAGELVAVLDDWSPSFSGPYLYYPSRDHMPAPLRAFIDFVKADGATNA
ncbi:LysR family transcriptional regulator [Methylovirgula sp. 4M-Z18]|uniref:LysR family transcriptional regulator n=1 Tax=Methylovirgula sp. 4M-Z18 TaxID=2293567 RepID=UPI000E2EC4C3|nr:LysR family transcriptional regulator [Methylovirgula sp. 4M-Z18]RFB75695.1 LysR family transcriptional regulator [Methylovirgula sp. 4M-Z18]